MNYFNSMSAHLKFNCILILVIGMSSSISGCLQPSQKKGTDMNYHQTIEQYYRAYKDADKEALRNILIADFKHISSYATYANRDEMIEEIWPEVGKSWAEDLQIFGTHPEFMVRYKIVGGERPSRNMSEYIRFEDDKITGIEVFMGRELE